MSALVFGLDRLCPTCGGCGWLRRVTIDGRMRIGRIGVTAAKRLHDGKHLRDIVPCTDLRCDSGVIHGR